jgi:hypothetical protein
LRNSNARAAFSLDSIFSPRVAFVLRAIESKEGRPKAASKSLRWLVDYAELDELAAERLPARRPPPRTTAFVLPFLLVKRDFFGAVFLAAARAFFFVAIACYLSLWFS